MNSQVYARSIAAATVSLLAGLLAVGCGGDGLPRESVSGEVIFRGNPLASGIITFVPIDPETPTQGGTTISQGKFSIPRAAGHVPGKYKVIISSGEGSKEQPVEDVDELGPGMPPIPKEEAIPSQYSGNTTLEATVTAGGDNVFAFSLD